MDKKKWNTDDIPDQSGKTVVITGANSGLGFEAAKVLSIKGATVIMAVRNIKKGEAALSDLIKRNSNASVVLMLLDLADLNSIREFTENFKSGYAKLDVLINNAGVMWPAKRELTRQGFEMQFGVNHLGHFALTGLFMDVLKKTQGSRVVTQSSLAHRMNGHINFKDINWERSYSKAKAYAQSKMANLLFTYELDRRFKEHEINAIALASHPGITDTELFRYANLARIFARKLAQNVNMGTLPVLKAATVNGLKGGEYFGPISVMETRGYPGIVKSNRRSYDKKLAMRLWSVSEELTGIKFL